MSPIRPDLVDVWIFRVLPDSGPGGDGEGHGGDGPRGGVDAEPAASPRVEFLLLRRAQSDLILPGLWQGVSGGLEPGESSVEAALREFSEETGLGAVWIEHLYHLDQVNQFLGPSTHEILSAAVLAVRVAPDAEPVISHEHDAMRWVSPEEALELAVWPAYRESIHRIVEILLDPDRATWFELALDGDRVKP
jgi:8-oxo-dGTP pyrophosphatase MutT (NUDIX family)